MLMPVMTMSPLMLQKTAPCGLADGALQSGRMERPGQLEILSMREECPQFFTWGQGKIFIAPGALPAQVAVIKRESKG